LDGFAVLAPAQVTQTLRRLIRAAATISGDFKMNLVTLCDVELRYTSIEIVDYGQGGQIYGTMEGDLRGDRLNGRVRLTNLAPQRPDNVNMPTLRGVLDTHDGAKIFIEMTGLANLRTPDQARVFVTSFTFRTAAAEYTWLNTVFAVLEGVLDTVQVGGVARGRAYICEVTL
jgi:hypothetical protein